MAIWDVLTGRAAFCKALVANRPHAPAVAQAALLKSLLQDTSHLLVTLKQMKRYHDPPLVTAIFPDFGSSRIFRIQSPMTAIFPDQWIMLLGTVPISFPGM